MKRTFSVLVIAFFFCPLLAQDAENNKAFFEPIQVQLDSLAKVRVFLQNQINNIDSQLDSLKNIQRRIEFEQLSENGILIEIHSKANLRDQPTPVSKVLKIIPSGSKLLAKAYEATLWQVNYDGIVGFVSDVYVKPTDQTKKFIELKASYSTPIKSGSQPSYQTSFGSSDSNFKASYNSSSKPSDPVQCTAYTKKGARCSRKTSDPSGRCWQHK